MEVVVAALTGLLTIGWFVFIFVYVLIIAARLSAVEKETRRQTKLLEELVQLIGSGDEDGEQD